MSNNLVLKKGLNVPLAGTAEPVVMKVVRPDVAAVKPTDFKGFVPKLLVKEGDPVLAGSPLMCHKQIPAILLTSPVSGTVKGIVRGEKRKLLAVLVEPGKEMEYASFPAGVPDTADQVKSILLNSGLWPAIVQRPYGVLASLETTPKAIFISSFSTAPLAPDTEFTLKDSLEDIQAAVDALAKFAPVHISVNAKVWSSSPFHKVENAVLHTVEGLTPPET